MKRRALCASSGVGNFPYGDCHRRKRPSQAGAVTVIYPPGKSRNVCPIFGFNVTYHP